MFRYVFVLLLALGSAAASSAQDSGTSLLAAARKRAAEATGKKGPELEVVLKDAIRLFEMIPEKFPEDGPSVARARLETGRAWRRLGRSADAEASLRRALEHPEEERTACDALHDLATLYRRAKKAEEARSVLLEIVDKHPGQAAARAQALIRLAGLWREAKEYARAEECLRACLKDHGDRWRSAVDALDDLVALKLRQKDPAEARRLLLAHEEALKARFAGNAQEERVERALEKMPCRARLGAAPAAESAEGEEGAEGKKVGSAGPSK